MDYLFESFIVLDFVVKNNHTLFVLLKNIICLTNAIKFELLIPQHKFFTLLKNYPDY